MASIQNTIHYTGRGRAAEDLLVQPLAAPFGHGRPISEYSPNRPFQSVRRVIFLRVHAFARFFVPKCEGRVLVEGGRKQSRRAASVGNRGLAAVFCPTTAVWCCCSGKAAGGANQVPVRDSPGLRWPARRRETVDRVEEAALEIAVGAMPHHTFCMESTGPRGIHSGPCQTQKKKR